MFLESNSNVLGERVFRVVQNSGKKTDTIGWVDEANNTRGRANTRTPSLVVRATTTEYSPNRRDSDIYTAGLDDLLGEKEKSYDAPRLSRVLTF